MSGGTSPTYAYGTVAREPTLVARWGAALVAGSLDRQVVSAAPRRQSRLLAAHIARLTSRRERTELVRALEAVLRRSQEGQPIRSTRVAPHCRDVGEAQALISAVVERLASATPVDPRGTARLRMLLADGSGPLYREQPGSLIAPLHSVIGAL
ncbi:hypothetical protein [Mycolicibacterium mengxianglii]|uniref:hypothetical protein n=1 Tax=Mycolicibacterium mengxianglii TaxID=2736649 RepID=UPI0018D0F326|nr:hypothetical protein [Mycolicibacterium mengxianglii]